MSNSGISVEEWNTYLENLFSWISEKYELMVNEEIDYNEIEYTKDLEYYEAEKKRIEELIESQEESSFALNQQTFEAFFGVSIDEEIGESNPFEFEPEENETDNDLEMVFEETPAYASELKIDKELEESINNRLSSYQLDDEPEIMDFSVFEPPEREDKTTYAHLLLLGDSATGRTSIRRAWMGRHFIEHHLSTIGASLDKKALNIDGKRYQVTLLDMGGQDFYKSIRSNFYRNVDGAVVVFDLTNPESFMRLDYWVKEYYRNVGKLLPFIIVGNKADAKNRKISMKQGERVASNYSRHTLPKFKVKYFEVSAKHNKNVNEMFEIILREARSFQMSQKR